METSLVSGPTPAVAAGCSFSGTGAHVPASIFLVAIGLGAFLKATIGSASTIRPGTLFKAKRLIEIETECPPAHGFRE
jgi:hypothetical protein